MSFFKKILNIFTGNDNDHKVLAHLRRNLRLNEIWIEKFKKGVTTEHELFNNLELDFVLTNIVYMNVQIAGRMHSNLFELPEDFYFNQIELKNEDEEIDKWSCIFLQRKNGSYKKFLLIKIEPIFENNGLDKELAFKIFEYNSDFFSPDDIDFNNIDLVFESKHEELSKSGLPNPSGELVFYKYGDWVLEFVRSYLELEKTLSKYSLIEKMSSL